MIRLHADALMVETATGETIPCIAEVVAVELVGSATTGLDPELLRHVSQAVLHYFKAELGRTTVTVGEFAQAIANVLRGFGLAVHTPETDPPPAEGVTDLDLRALACESGKGFELAFFVHLRRAFRSSLQHSPRLLRFTGLRSCVKQLVGARRWTDRCQAMNDQIVEFLRQCLHAEPARARCSLVVR
jgi:hypothetical protein